MKRVINYICIIFFLFINTLIYSGKYNNKTNNYVLENDGYILTMKNEIKKLDSLEIRIDLLINNKSIKTKNSF